MPSLEGARARILTPRLDLVTLAPDLVAALAADDVAAAQALASFPVTPETFAGDDYVLRLRAAQLAVDPTEEPWLLRAAVLRGLGEVVGKVGFHSRPDESAVVEIGYRVAPDWRGRGLAKEMATGALGWAAENGATACLASVRPDNAPSLAIVRALGFGRVGEQMDEVDGLEWIFRLDLTGPLPPLHPGQ